MFTFNVYDNSESEYRVFVQSNVNKIKLCYGV